MKKIKHQKQFNQFVWMNCMKVKRWQLLSDIFVVYWNIELVFFLFEVEYKIDLCRYYYLVAFQNGTLINRLQSTDQNLFLKIVSWARFTYQTEHIFIHNWICCEWIEMQRETFSFAHLDLTFPLSPQTLNLLPQMSNTHRCILLCIKFESDS